MLLCAPTIIVSYSFVKINPTIYAVAPLSLSHTPLSSPRVRLIMNTINGNVQFGLGQVGLVLRTCSVAHWNPV